MLKALIKRKNVLVTYLLFVDDICNVMQTSPIGNIEIDFHVVSGGAESIIFRKCEIISVDEVYILSI